jgi:hypothetical protein
MKAAFISWWQARRIAAKLLRIQAFIVNQHPDAWGTIAKWAAVEAVDKLRREVLYGKY